MCTVQEYDAGGTNNDEKQSHVSQVLSFANNNSVNRSAVKQEERLADELESDFESDPPSPRSSEEEELDQEDEEVLHGDLVDDNDTEPENLGQKPLLMDSGDEADEDEEEKHSSDSDISCTNANTAKVNLCGSGEEPAAKGLSEEIRSTLTSQCELPRSAGKASANQEFDVFGAVPFFAFHPVQPQHIEHRVKDQADPPSLGELVQAPKHSEFDVFSKAPFSKKTNQSEFDKTPPVSPESLDIFGCIPFHPLLSTKNNQSTEDVFGLVPFEELTSSTQQQKLKQQRNLQKISGRQRRTKQEKSNGNSKRHHGTPTCTKKSSKPSFRTPERARRHKKAGRRDSQSSNEVLTISDSKENISITLADGKERANTLQAEESLLDPFGAKPFHPQDVRHSQFQGPGNHHGEHIAAGSNRSSQTSLHSAFYSGEGLHRDDFGAVPFTELLVPGIAQQPQQQAPHLIELDLFGAAPFPSKQ
ncbi:putative BMP-2-inducible kinase-like protein [Ambystoma mexicanum]|uniref:putative BMP-2-inducible kinase-like protein n=1 Tax=Ambystoma mexicanum TaxID=8296 RepID=UPI0037E70B7B